MKTNILNSNQIKVQKPSLTRNLRAMEFNPYFRQVNLNKLGEFKPIPANKERVKKASPATIVIDRPFGKQVRFRIRTKSDLIAAEKAARFLKPITEKVSEPVKKVKKLKFTFKKIRKVMRLNGKGSFKMVWKVTNNINDTVKYFVTKVKANVWILDAKKLNNSGRSF